MLDGRSVRNEESSERGEGSPRNFSFPYKLLKGRPWRKARAKENIQSKNKSFSTGGEHEIKFHGYCGNPGHTRHQKGLKQWGGGGLGGGGGGGPWKNVVTRTSSGSSPQKNLRP